MRNRQEFNDQCGVIEWTKYRLQQYPELELLYSIPNGGSRHKIEAINLKRSGVKAGVPDLCLPVARNGFHALYIEMKTKKGKLSPKQIEIHALLKRFDNKVEVAHGLAEATEIIEAYLSSKR